MIKKTFLLLLLYNFIDASECFAQQKFQVTSLTRTENNIIDINHSLNGGIISLGESVQNGTSFIEVQKMLSDFSQAWAFSFFSTDSVIHPTTFTECNDQGLIFAAQIMQSDSTGYPASDILLFKTDESGQLIWSRRIDHFRSDKPRSIIRHPNGSIYIASQSAASSLSPLNNISLIHCDSTGNPLWSKSIGGSGDDIPSKMILTSDSKLAVGGTSTSFSAGAGFFLTKLDTSGNYYWFKNYFTGFQDSCNSLLQTNDGGFIMLGSGGLDGSDILLIKTDPDGIVQTARSYNLGFGTNANFDSGLNIIMTADGGYALSGITRINGSISPFVFIIKLSPNLIVDWYNTYGFQLKNKAVAFLQMPDQGYLIAGSRKFPNSTVFRNLMIKTDSVGESGCLQTTVDLTENTETPFTSPVSPASLNTIQHAFTFPLQSALPLYSSDTSCFLLTGLELPSNKPPTLMAYPNPFTDQMSIEFIDDQSNIPIDLFVYDHMGLALYRESFPANERNHSIKLNLSDGIYLLTLNRNSKQICTKKIICIHK